MSWLRWNWRAVVGVLMIALGAMFFTWTVFG